MSKQLQCLLVLFGFLFGGFLCAQEKTVTGTVTDSNGFSLHDVSVKSSSGEEVFTDTEGNYSIQAKVGDVLTIETLGMEIVTVVVGASDVYNATLRSSSAVELEGVVVTALGITREKKSLGYATQEVSGETLTNSRNSNPLNALSGNVAGVQITNSSSNLGGSTRIIMRGIKSITQENRPLIVIDGIPLANTNINDINTQRGAGGRDYGDAAFDMNPDDIETINVLKGGPASALYGSRASNGVIMITTKKGKKGRDEVILNTGVSFESISTIPKLQNLYGGGSMDTFNTVEINGVTYNIAEYDVDESWGPKLEGQPVLHWDAFDPEFPNDYLVTRPWSMPKADAESFFNTGITYNNSLSFSKSFEKSIIKASLSNVKQHGIVPNSELERTTVSLGINTYFGENFALNGSLTYVRTDGFNRPEVGYGDNSVPQKIFQWGQRQLDYNRLKNYKMPDGRQRPWNRSSWDDPIPAYSDNPYWTVYENVSNDRRDRFYGTIELKYDISPGFYALGKVSGDTYDFRLDERVAIGSQALPKYTEAARKFTEMNYEFRMHYDKKWENFSINSFIGVSRRQQKSANLFGQTNGGLAVPDLYTIQNSLDLPTSTSSKVSRRVNSAFATISLGFYNTFFIEGTGRNDWFSTLPEKNNSYFYPSITGSWIFSELLKTDWLSFGKLRAGWSSVSNDLPAYQIIDTFIFGDNFLNTPTLELSNTKMNRDLKPEYKKTWEVGIEAQLFKNRLGFDVTYYQENVIDVLVPVQHSYSTGYGFKWLNAGELENKGIEALVKIVPIRTQDFEWTLTWNFAKNDNTVVNIADNIDSYNLTNAPFSVQLWAIKGESFGQIRGTDFVYDENGNKIIDSDGLYKKSGVKNLGSIIPDYNMGFRNTFSYKNFDLSVLIDIQKGGKFFSLSHMWGMYSGMLEETAANGVRENGIILNGVIEKFDEGGNFLGYETNNIKVDAMEYYKSYYNGVDAQNVFNADYIKLRDVSLSYTLPSNIIRPFSNITISAFARNLFTWGLDKKGFDPEMASYGSGNVQGIEGGSLPATRTYGMNLKLQF